MGTLCTVRGGKFTARAFGNYCAEKGIQRNGVVERETKPRLAWHGACSRQRVSLVSSGVKR